jgi:diaminopimelate decarboxylase
MKTIPFTEAELLKLAETYPTPFHIYDEQAIRKNCRDFYEAFSWVHKGFKNYFAVKALPNPYIMEILKEEGMGADCSSYAELELAKAVGIEGEDIMFTSNDTPAYEFRKAKELDAIINLDDISHLDYIEKEVGLPDLICMRYNPGSMKAGNEIIGKPEEAKYGFTREQLTQGFAQAKEKGISRFALHTMVASNELNVEYFVETAEILFRAAGEIYKELGITFEFINLGGGIGIPYRPNEEAVDLQRLSEGIKQAYDSYILGSGHPEVQIVMECGRMVTGPYGYLVSTVRHRKETYKTYIGLDSCMANLMRPGMYDAYHHVSTFKNADAETETVDVTGSLCENNDKFAIDRTIPKVDAGDFVIIHDTGAHGHSMGFNYNGKLRSAEFLMKNPGNFKLIRRAETLDDLFATLEYEGL